MAADFSVEEDYGSGPVYADLGPHPDPFENVDATPAQRKDAEDYANARLIQGIGQGQVISPANQIALGNGTIQVNPDGTFRPAGTPIPAEHATMDPKVAGMLSPVDQIFGTGDVGGIKPSLWDQLTKPFADFFASIGTGLKWVIVGGAVLIVYNLASKTK